MLKQFADYVLPEWFGEVTQEFVDEKSNGCGPTAWKIDLVPDALMGIEYEIPCRIHDIEYAMGLDKEGADGRLFVNMCIACLRQHSDRFDEFIPLALLFLVSVRRHGKEHFGGPS